MRASGILKAVRALGSKSNCKLARDPRRSGQLLLAQYRSFADIGTQKKGRVSRDLSNC
jgi:hypothetical protein